MDRVVIHLGYNSRRLQHHDLKQDIASLKNAAIKARLRLDFSEITIPVDLSNSDKLLMEAVNRAAREVFGTALINKPNRVSAGLAINCTHLVYNADTANAIIQNINDHLLLKRISLANRK